MTRSRPGLLETALLVAATLAPGIGRAVTVNVDTRYESTQTLNEETGSEQKCVSKIIVEPMSHKIPNDPKDVQIEPGANGEFDYEIVWTLKALGQPAGGTTVWAIEKTGGNFDICPSSIVFDASGVATCKAARPPKAASGAATEAIWEYTITAKLGGCGNAELDPRIIFRDGGETMLPWIPILVAVAAIVLLSLFFLARRRRSTG